VIPGETYLGAIGSAGVGFVSAGVSAECNLCLLSFRTRVSTPAIKRAALRGAEADTVREEGCDGCCGRCACMWWCCGLAKSRLGCGSGLWSIDIWLWSEAPAAALNRVPSAK